MIPIPQDILFGYYSPVINDKLSQHLELIAFEFNDRTRFYNITEDGVLDMVYEYMKKRDSYDGNVMLLKEKINCLRRGRIVTICEAIDTDRKETVGGVPKWVTTRTYELEKFEL